MTEIVCESCNHQNASGSKVCFACFKPISLTNRDMLLLSIDYVPGREIDHAIGVVLGHGDAWSGTSRNRVAQSRQEAISDIRAKALGVGADAVVGLTVTVSGIRGFWGIGTLGQSAVVQATGTAVKLKA